MAGRQIVFDTLKELGIPYELIEHEAVYTIEEMERLELNQRGDIVKNLFLRDAKGKRHFLVMMREDKQADLKKLESKLGSSKLSFASEDRLMKFLGLTKGSVTPFGVLNDAQNAVEVAFDKDLVDQSRLGVHPNENTATLFLSFADIERVVKSHGNKISYVAL